MDRSAICCRPMSCGGLRASGNTGRPTIMSAATGATAILTILCLSCGASPPRSTRVLIAETQEDPSPGLEYYSFPSDTANGSVSCKNDCEGSGHVVCGVCTFRPWPTAKPLPFDSEQGYASSVRILDWSCVDTYGAPFSIGTHYRTVGRRAYFRCDHSDERRYVRENCGEGPECALPRDTYLTVQW